MSELKTVDPWSAPSPTAASPVQATQNPRQGSLWLNAAILTLMVIATLVPILGGLELGDHEALVAQCAREMRETGNWLLPHYLGEPYPRKPPLPYWLIAGLSYLFPNDAATGLPVTTTLARLPSALAALGTVLLLWKLASSMFGPRVGRVTAVIATSSLCILLYAANATVEMLLTFCCTWAHTHFWLGVHQPLRSWRRRIHLFWFYVAMGVGMMAKGPFPLVMVTMPIAAWWYCGRAWPATLRDLVRGIGPRTVQAFKELWLLPGLVVFALCFVPWLIVAGMRHPEAWNLWNWQYLQRVQGNYEDTRPRKAFYYIPIIAGLVMPWLFLLGEAIIAPWIRKYARERVALLYAGSWALIGAVVMSAIDFKKPYYVTPMIPGLLLMMGIVAERFYSTPISRPKLARILYGLSLAGGVGALIGGFFLIRKEMPGAEVPLTAVAGVALILLAVAGLMLIRSRAWAGFGMTAVASVLTFILAWQLCGRYLDNMAKVTALNSVLEKQGIPKKGDVYWVSRRPDSRLSFYYARYTRQMIQPAEIVRHIVDRTEQKKAIQGMVTDRAKELLSSSQPVYLVLDREEYQLAKILGFVGGAHMIGAAPDEKDEDKDWLVISNVKAKE